LHAALSLAREAFSDAVCWNQAGDASRRRLAEIQDAEHRRKIVGLQLKEGIRCPIFDRILKTKLYPYQREGALFAVNAGRCLIATIWGSERQSRPSPQPNLGTVIRHPEVIIVSPTSSIPVESRDREIHYRSVQVARA